MIHYAYSYKIKELEADGGPPTNRKEIKSMVTISDALKLIEAGFSVEDIRAMDTPAEQPKPEQKLEQEQKPEQKPEKEQKTDFDMRLDKLTSVVENLVETVGKLPFSFSMGDYTKEDDVNSVLAAIINPNEKKGDK